VATPTGRVYTDSVGMSETWFYWIRFISYQGVTGPFNATAGTEATTAEDPAVVAALLNGILTESQLAMALQTRINQIDTPGGILDRLLNTEGDILASETDITNLEVTVNHPATGVSATSSALGTLATRVTSAEGTITTSASDITSLKTTVNNPTTGVVATSAALGALDSRVTSAEGTITSSAGSITALQATVNNPATGVAATAGAVSALTSRVTSAEGTISSSSGSITTLQSTVNNPTTGVTATASALSSLTTNVTTIDGKVTSISAQYMVKLDVNGYVSGFGLYSDGGSSTIAFNVDNFFIGKLGQTNASPFALGVVNGVTKIALNAATFIPDATITNAKINTLSATKLTVASGTIAEAIIGTGHIGNAMIGNIIQSASYNPGAGIGWQIDKAGSITAAAITIRDSSGNIILSSGTTVASDILNSSQTWSAITGAGKPTDNADKTSLNTAAGILGQGAFATLSQITTGNVGTYIAGAAIGRAYIATAAINTALIDNLAVTTAKIDNLAVGTAQIASLAVSTLKIGDEAVTVASGISQDLSGTLTTSWQTVASITVDMTTGSNPTPVAVLVSAFGNYQNTVTTGTVYDIAFRILAGGLSSGDVAQTHGNITSVVSSMAKYTGLTGSVLFEVQMKKNNAAGTYLGRNSGLVIHGVRK
jgi:hypothetical protein